jgi:hypothetical protein
VVSIENGGLWMKHPPIPVLLALSFCAVLIQCQSAFSGGSRSFTVGSKDIVESSGENGSIDCGRFVLFNDMLENGSSLRYSQSVYRNLRTGVMGWEWNTGSLRSLRGGLMGFPSVRFGKFPPRGASTTPEMPVKASEFKKKASFDFTLEARGSYATAFLLSFASKPDPGPNDVLLQASIWIDHADYDGPAPDRVKSFSSDGRRFRFEQKTGSPDNGRIPARFVSEKPIRSATLSLGAFLKFLISEGAVPPGYYLESLSFGNEIVAGRGRMTIKRFELK